MVLCCIERALLTRNRLSTFVPRKSAPMGTLVVEDLRSAVDAHSPLPALQPPPELQEMR